MFLFILYLIYFVIRCFRTWEVMAAFRTAAAQLKSAIMVCGAEEEEEEKEKEDASILCTVLRGVPRDLARGLGKARASGGGCGGCGGKGAGAGKGGEPTGKGGERTGASRQLPRQGRGSSRVQRFTEEVEGEADAAEEVACRGEADEEDWGVGKRRRLAKGGREEEYEESASPGGEKSVTEPKGRRRAWGAGGVEIAAVGGEKRPTKSLAPEKKKRRWSEHRADRRCRNEQRGDTRVSSSSSSGSGSGSGSPAASSPSYRCGSSVDTDLSKEVTRVIVHENPWAGVLCTCVWFVCACVCARACVGVCVRACVCVCACVRVCVYACVFLYRSCVPVWCGVLARREPNH